MLNDNQKDASRQSPGTTSTAQQKPLPLRKQQAIKLYSLYNQIKETGVIPEQETYTKDLGDLAPDLDELIRQYRIDGNPGMHEAFITLARNNKNVMWAVANASPAQEKAEKPQEEDDKRFIKLPTGKRVLKLYSIDDVYGFPDPEYLIYPILGAGSVSLLYGRSGTGKTFTSLHLALSVAHGIDWLGYKVKKQGIVWYINGEGNRAFKKRLKAWYKEHPHLKETSNFRVIPWALDLKENYQDLLDTITYTIEATGETPVFIVIDNFSTCADVDQTKQEQVTPILKQLHALVQEYGPHVMVIHHTNKDDDFNGTMAFRNHVDTMIQLKKADKADKHSPILFCCDKPRDDEPFKDIKTELKQVVLYMDQETLETISSCVVVLSQQTIQVDGLRDTPQNCLDILGDRTLSYTVWMKECVDSLKISKATFDRTRDELVSKDYVKKYRPDDARFDQYCSSITSSGESRGEHE
jgi:archaellum biogenesis ATPase FlaH